jgi:predicted metal-dependent peptidase
MARDMCVATAAVRLMLKFPFWCELYYSMKVIETSSVNTLATDGKRMWVNPKFWETLSLDYKVSALAHETCHKMLHHCTRGKNHIMPWSNIAMDIVVNTLLKENGFSIAPTWVQPDSKYSGKTYEFVYHDLMSKLQQPPPQPKGGEGSDPKPEQGDDDEEGGDDDVDGDEEGEEGEESSDGEGEGEGDEEGEGDGPPSGSGYCDGPGVPVQYRGAWADVKQFVGSPEEVEAFEEKVEQQVQQALAAAKQFGHAPVGVEMAAKFVVKVADEKWYDHLQRFFQSLRLAEYDWNKINRRMAMRYRVVAPTQFTERLGKVVIFVDASGSCWSDAIQSQFASHINAILSEAQPEETHVVFFDTLPHKHVIVDPGTIEFEEPPCGGGGTSIRWLQPWLDEEGIDPAVVIILTDMYIDFPTEEPTYPLIWASTTPNMKAPFGETIHIKS